MALILTQPTDRCIIVGSVISLCERGRLNLFRITKMDLGNLGVNYILQNYNKHLEAWMPIHTINKSSIQKLKNDDEVKKVYFKMISGWIDDCKLYEQELD